MTKLERLLETDALARLRDGDATLFAADADGRQVANDSLGFTTLALDALGHLPALKEFAEQVRSEGTTDVVLLGMGGSSLAPLVISNVMGSAPGYPALHVLDTTCPDTVLELRDRLDPARTLWLVSSKSGGTVEPNALYAVFRTWADEALGRDAAGGRFVAITDPGSSLATLAKTDGFRRTFLSAPRVGGRYSALTLFGLVPAALIGVDLTEFTERALATERHLAATPTQANPAAALASILAGGQANGVDKLTVVTSPALSSFGLWIEQLVAESLGKEGTGVVPVIELAAAPPPHSYGQDRIVAVISLDGDSILHDWSGLAALERALFSFVLENTYDLAAQFVIWEWSIALLGVLLEVNPFGQPDVAAAKAATEAVLSGELTPPASSASLQGCAITYAGALPAPAQTPATLVDALAPAIAALQPEEYLAVLAFLPEDDALVELLEGACATLSIASGHALTLELGPRYLHSTGQLHKGGPDTGVFVMLSAPPERDVEVPGRPWTLGQLYRAQADGDFATLAERGRRVLRVDLPDGSAKSVSGVADALLELAFRS